VDRVIAVPFRDLGARTNVLSENDATQVAVSTRDYISCFKTTWYTVLRAAVIN
jgi:hypothetical protein